MFNHNKNGVLQARPLLIRALETGDFSELVDPRLGKSYVESEMFRMIEAAAACIRHSAPKRPRMVQVLHANRSEHLLIFFGAAYFFLFLLRALINIK